MYFTLFITVILTAVVLVVGAYVVAKLIGPRSYNKVKGEPYECGIRHPFPHLRCGNGFPVSVGSCGEGVRCHGFVQHRFLLGCVGFWPGIRLAERSS